MDCTVAILEKKNNNNNNNIIYRVRRRPTDRRVRDGDGERKKENVILLF